MRAAWLVTWLFPGSLLAQTLLFDRITTAEGLPGDEVFTVYEDRKGFVWAGTRTGLARLEGTRIRVFHHDRNDSTTLAHDQVNDVQEDASGRLWFATMSGLSCFDPVTGGFVNYRVRGTGNEAHQANRMIQVECVSDTLLWIGTEGGFYRFHTGRRTFLRVDGGPAGEGPEGRPQTRKAFKPDAPGIGWWCATTKGMAYWNAGTDRWTDYRNVPAGSACFLEESCSSPLVCGDTLWWFETESYNLVSCDTRTGITTRYDSVDGTRNHFTLRWQDRDPGGRHWLSTWTHRLFYRDGEGAWSEVMPSMDAGALRSGHVSASCRRRNGERWFATDKGLAILRPGSEAMRLYPLHDAHGEISRLLVMGDTLVIGTSRGGVVLLDVRSGDQHYAFFQRPPSAGDEVYWGNSITGLAPRDASTCWVATSCMPALLDLRNGVLRDAPISVPDVFPPTRMQNTTFVLPEGDSVLWVGTWSDGLFRVDIRSGAHTVTGISGGPYGAVASDMILCMYSDRQHRWWLGMNDGGGLAFLEDGRFSRVLDQTGSNVAGVVRCIAEAPDGTIWLGTHEEGIVQYDPVRRSTRYFTRRQGLPGVRVEQILFDNEGNAWACTDQGVAVLRAGSASFRAFGFPVGWSGGEVNAMAELPDGRLAFAHGRHVMMYDPARAVLAQRPPEARLTAYLVNGRVYADSVPPSALVLEDGHKALAIEFGAVGPYSASRPLFRYRRSAAVPWVDLGAAQRLDLFDLPVGKHTIELQASANGVDWSVAPASVAVEVLPMFYATWWFRGLILSVITALLFIGFRLYVRTRLRVQRETFQREQAVLQERVRIAGDMHDDLGAGLSALKLRSEMALRVEKDPIKREHLGSLAHTAGELIGSMRQIIWTMNGDQTSIEDLVSYTTNYARTYCEQNNLVSEIIAIKVWPGLQLTSEQRRNIFLVVKEALHNVVKHANARTVRIVMRWRDGLLVEVQDDGVGLPAHTQHSEGNGLRNMRKRIAALGGNMGAETWMGLPDDLTGTRIRFRVPLDTNQGSIAQSGAPQDLRRL